MKFGSVWVGLANRHLLPEFGELWPRIPRYYAATCISYSLMHLLNILLVINIP